MTTLSESEKIWLKYKDRFRKTDYSKFQPKKFYEPINIEKEQELIIEQNQQKSYESQFPYYDELPRMSRQEMFPHKGITKIEHFGYIGMFSGIALGRVFGEIYYVFISSFAIDFQPQNLQSIYQFYKIILQNYFQLLQNNRGINEIQHFDEVSNRYFDLKFDAFKDIKDIKYNDQRIEKKDYKAILNVLEQRKLEIKKKQLYDQI